MHVNCISLSGISRAWKLICARELRGLWPLPDHVFRAENRTSFFGGCDVAGYYVQKMSTCRGSDACKTKSWFVRVKVGLNLHLVLQSTQGACQRGVRFIVHPSVYNWVWEFLNCQSEPHIFLNLAGYWPMLVVLLLLLKKEAASMKRELLDNGNIWQKSDGRWIGLVRYKDEFGVTQRKSFSSKKKKTLLMLLRRFFFYFKKNMKVLKMST